MQMNKVLRAAVCVGLLILGTTATAWSQNVLLNPGFEAGTVGYGAANWNAFGNVYTEAVTPHDGAQVGKMFGQWWGVLNVGGFFQEFPTTQGSEWQMSSFSRHNTGDAMTGSKDGGGNFVVQKIVFFDAADAEISAVESVILDGTFPTDIWFENVAITGIAPAGAVKVRAFLLYIQPLWDGGAALVDDVSFGPATVATENSSWGQLKTLYGN